MKIAEWFGSAEEGAVLADASESAVRLWAIVPRDKVSIFRMWFPAMDAPWSNRITCLGRWHHLVAAIEALAAAKTGSKSPVIQNLHLVAGLDDPGIQSILERRLLGPRQ